MVAVFMFMRLVGWPARRISILTTYNGQKHLIRDVITKRCADNPLIGTPHKVSGHNRLRNVVGLDWGICFLPVIGLWKSEAREAGRIAGWPYVVQHSEMYSPILNV